VELPRQHGGMKSGVILGPSAMQLDAGDEPGHTQSPAIWLSAELGN
jgi:hypothetical protein